jgi:hypothetical protein
VGPVPDLNDNIAYCIRFSYSVGAGGTVVATTGNELSDQIAGVGGVACEHNLAGEDWLPENAVAGVVDCCWVLLYGRSHIWKKLNLLTKSTKSTSFSSQEVLFFNKHI